MSAPSLDFVHLRGVYKRFPGSTFQLTDIHLSANKGDFISFIGSSGCGKTTLLNIIAGLSTPSAGEITVMGEHPQALKHKRSFVFQDPTLMPWLNVRSNVALPLKLAKEHLPCDRIDTLLQLVGLGTAAQLYPRQLSGGMKMRTSIARALILHPELILLDEPFSALDEITRNHLNEELLLWRQAQPFSAFFVTHSVNEAVFLSNKVCILSLQGSLTNCVEIDAPFPRTAEFRHSEQFQQYVQVVYRALQKAMAS